jgi:nucleoid-associated protein YgaU
MTRDHKLALVVGFGLILFVGILVTDHLSATTQSDDLLPQNAVTSDWDQPLTLAATPRATFRDEAIGSTAPRATPIRNDARPRTAEVVIEPEISLEPEEVVVERPVPRSPERVIHVVQSGETLQEISKRYFQTVRRWKDIADANRNVLPNPDRLRSGIRLVIPDATVRTDDRRIREVVDARTYTVRPGDSLSSIAGRELGDPRRYPEIKRRNRLNGDSLQPGQKLQLPDR